MPEMKRGLHVTQYKEDCFSMSSITIKFIDKERNEGEEKLPKMEKELAEAKTIVKDLLLDITMKSSVFYHIEQVRS